MIAQVIRSDRYGEPRSAFRPETVEVPPIGPDDVLVAVMAAGINYNSVWAALGYPVDIIGVRRKQGESESFHIGGSEASGIVYRVGTGVGNVKVGDEVVVHPGYWEKSDPWIQSGGDPLYAPSQRSWGYETNFGAFAQFCRVKAHQCLPKPAHLTWEEAASYILTGATAYRMLTHWEPNRVKKGDIVLIWGGAGGLGSMALQLVNYLEGISLAVVSSTERMEICKKLGAAGVINRSLFDHWGPLGSEINEPEKFKIWLSGVRRFGKAIWEITGPGRNPALVFEHTGEATLPTSAYVCEAGGMVVICGGTTGYLASMDLRFHWMRQKRFQGSHFANQEECLALNRLLEQKKILPVLSNTFRFEQTGEAHQLMRENRHPPGNMAILVGAPREGMGVR